MSARRPWTMMRCLLAATAFSALPSGAVAAEPAPFDLAGPGLRVTVTRQGTTLPIAQVPAMAEGDTIIVDADFPADQRARFLLVSAFLQGAINPPPKTWIQIAEPWKTKDKDRRLELTVPKGARQLIVFLVPASGGAASAISDAVRGRPGEFVRATQELNQASLDRVRLDAFMGAIRAQENSHPEHLRSVAPTLAHSLSIKLNEECLGKVIELQAACLLENRDTLVLADVHSSTMAETLIGAPTDLAMQISSTREAGLGYYSPYIGVIRDIARVFGAFSNPELGYLPTLSLRRNENVSLLMNAAPSFSKPRSVLVASMPAIDADSPPRLRVASEKPLCGARPGLLLPIEGAPLIYATDYLRAPKLQLSADGRTIELPLEARADRGGYVIDGPVPADLKGELTGQLTGFWGFNPYQGPKFRLQFPTEGEWRPSDSGTNLVSGRDNVIALSGPAPACVTGATMRRGKADPVPVATKLGENGQLELTLPLKDVRPGELALEIGIQGQTRPATLTLRAYAQASRLDQLVLHEGDRWAMLTGQRLDQVARVTLGELTLLPDGLSRQDNVDRLRLAAQGNVPSGELETARVSLADGRTLSVPATAAPPRPAIMLLERSFTQGSPPPGGLRFDIPAGGDLLADNAKLVFSLRAAEGSRLLPDDIVEVIAGDDGHPARLTPGKGLRLQGSDVAVATLEPGQLGASAFGPLRVRLVRGSDDSSDWLPLTSLVRLPRIAALDCRTAAAQNCTLRGDQLFLLASVAANAEGASAVQVPEGFTGSSLTVPRPRGGRLYVQLRDAPATRVALITVP